jgi:hypothetical protein
VFAFNAANVSGGAIFAESAEFPDTQDTSFVQNTASHSAGACFFVQTGQILLRLINSTYDSSMKEIGFAALSSCERLIAVNLIVYRSKSPSGGSVFSNFGAFYLRSSRFLQEETGCSVCLTGTTGGRIKGSTFANLSAGIFVVSNSSEFCYVQDCMFSRGAAFCFSAGRSIVVGDTNVYAVVLQVKRPGIHPYVISMHLLHNFSEDLPVVPPSESPRAFGRGPKGMIDLGTTIAVMAVIGLGVGVLWCAVCTADMPKVPLAIGAGSVSRLDPKNLADLDGLL